MPRISNDLRLQVIGWKNEGLGYKKISKKLETDFNHSISANGVKKICKKYTETGEVTNRKRFGG